MPFEEPRSDTGRSPFQAILACGVLVAAVTFGPSFYRSLKRVDAPVVGVEIPEPPPVDPKDTAMEVTAFGETKTAGEWLKDPRCNTFTIAGRIRRGWDNETAITTPYSKEGDAFIDFQMEVKRSIENCSICKQGAVHAHQ